MSARASTLSTALDAVAELGREAVDRGAVLSLLAAGTITADHLPDGRVQLILRVQPEVVSELEELTQTAVPSLVHVSCSCPPPAPDFLDC
jgi:hypothetical protein